MEQYIGTVGEYTNQAVKTNELEDPELSHINGTYSQEFACPLCSQPMQLIFRVHSPLDEYPNRIVLFYVCKKCSKYEFRIINEPATPAKQEVKMEIEEKPVEQPKAPEGFGFISNFDDIDLNALVNASVAQPTQSAPSKAKKEKKDKDVVDKDMKWINLYDEMKEVKECNEEEETKKIKSYNVEDAGEDDYEKSKNHDWDKFIKSMSNNPNQILRMYGDILYIDESNRTLCSECKCKRCNSTMEFELQVLPSLLSVVKNLPEFGSFVLLSCPQCGDECEVVQFPSYD